MYAYIEDGEIVRFDILPRVWFMKDGTTISGFHLLEKSIILSEGWYEVEQIDTDFNNETHHIVNIEYQILEDKVISKYVVEPITETEPITEIEPITEVELLTEYIVDVDFRLAMIELGFN